jgi:hypothetical protein
MSKNKPSYTGAYYVKSYVYRQTLKRSLARAAKALKTISKEFDSIAFTGMSGACTAPTLALRLNKELIMVRKDNDTDCHEPRKVHGNDKCKNYVIVDDFTSSGETAERVQREIFRIFPHAHCLGVLEVNRVRDDDKGLGILETRYNLDLDLTKKEIKKCKDIITKAVKQSKRGR